MLRNAEGAAKKYDRSVLLDQHALERLNRRNVQRERELSRLIEIAAGRLRTRHEELDRHTSKRNPKGAELELRREIKKSRQEMIGASQTAAVEAVREFAAGLLLSQSRLVVHAVLLRSYTAHIVSDIRGILGTSQVFQMEPLLPWGEGISSRRKQFTLAKG